MTEKEAHDTSSTDEKPVTGASRRDFLVGTGAVTATTLLGSGQVAADTSDTGNRVVGYYPSWAGSDYTPSDIPFGTITALNYAFLEPQSDGTVVLGDADPNHIQAVSNNSDADTDLLFSISGGWYPQEYSDAASTAANRQRFASTAVDHVLNFGFDGVDLDWEYPDGTTSPDDPGNFELLVGAVRAELDARVGTDAPLTIAASPAPSTANDAYLDGIFDDLDYVHVMTYNYHGDWSTYTNFNAPLYSGPDDPHGPDWNVSSHMSYWSGRPIADADLVMGIPFYGRVFEGVRSDQNNGLYQEFVSESAEVYDVIENDLKSDPSYDYFWHADAKVPWLYQSRGRGEFVSYDDSNSVGHKMDFVLNNGFGGAFCWELSQDPSDTLLGVMHSKLH
jgi:chitinase